MGFLMYSGHAYIINRSNSEIMHSLGDWFVTFMQYANLMPTSTQTGDVAQYHYFFENDGYIGGSAILKAENESLVSNLQALNPLTTGHIIPDNLISSAYTIKIVFNDGRYLISQSATSTSGIQKFTGYDAEDNLIGTGIYCNVSTSLRTVGSLWYQQIVISSITTGVFPDSGTMYVYSAVVTESENQYFRDSAYEEITTDSNTYKFFTSLEPYTPAGEDPYSPGGESETGGGTGDFDGTSDPIDFPDLPTLSATDAGFITLFNPNATQLKALATYMWSNSLFDLATWKKIFADPMDAILGLTIVPVDVPAGANAAVKVGNISTDIYMTSAASQYVAVDCGTLNVNEYWGAYLDYEPFTKAEIYLPYIGTHAIAVDDIMGKEVHVKYHIDILSGACAAYVKCGDSVLYTFIGQCASSIPITGSDMTNVINGVISAAVSIGTMVATGGASAPVSVPALANTAVNQMKPSIEKSGSMSGTGGMLGIQTPYLILTRPRQCLPAAQNEFMGYPSFISSVMGDLSGYTEVEQVHLDGIAATDAEISEIENLLKSGVIF